MHSPAVPHRSRYDRLRLQIVLNYGTDGSCGLPPGRAALHKNFLHLWQRCCNRSPRSKLGSGPVDQRSVRPSWKCLPKLDPVWWFQNLRCVSISFKMVSSTFSRKLGGIAKAFEATNRQHQAPQAWMSGWFLPHVVFAILRGANWGPNHCARNLGWHCHRSGLLVQQLKFPKASKNGHYRKGNPHQALVLGSFGPYDEFTGPSQESYPTVPTHAKIRKILISRTKRIAAGWLGPLHCPTTLENNCPSDEIYSVCIHMKWCCFDLFMVEKWWAKSKRSVVTSQAASPKEAIGHNEE